MSGTSRYASPIDQAADDDPLPPEFDPDETTLEHERQDELIAEESTDDDLSGLFAILARVKEADAQKKALSQKYKRLHHLRKAHTPDAESERQQLIRIIAEMEEGIVWVTQAAVALIHSQVCLTCGSEHRFMMGWMTEQTHKVDPNTRRLRAGRPEGVWPAKVETHPQAPVEVCANCVESCIAIDRAAGAAT